jgi:predicted porin
VTADNYFGSIFCTPGDVDNYHNNFRVSNAIKYVSQTFGGVQVEGLYALGGVAGQTSAGQSYGLAVSYTQGGLGLAGGYFYSKTNNSAASFNSTADTNNGDTAINQVFADGARSLSIGRLGAQYIMVRLRSALLTATFSTVRRLWVCTHPTKRLIAVRVS